MKPQFPSEIIMDDADGGFFLAKLDKVMEIDKDQWCPIYKQVEYYHDLESAIGDADPEMVIK